MAPPASKKPSFLTRKVGPLPMWLVLILTTVVGWWLYKRMGSASANTTASTPQPSPSTQAVPATDTTGLTGGAGTAGDFTGAATAGVNPSDLLASLGAQNSTLTSALLQQEQDIAANAASEVAAFQNGAGGASTTTNITNNYYGKTKPQPGTHNTPTVQHHPKPVARPAHAAPKHVTHSPKPSPSRKPAKPKPRKVIGGRI